MMDTPFIHFLEMISGIEARVILAWTWAFIIWLTSMFSMQRANVDAQKSKKPHNACKAAGIELLIVSTQFTIAIIVLTGVMIMTALITGRATDDAARMMQLGMNLFYQFMQVTMILGNLTRLLQHREALAGEEEQDRRSMIVNR